MTNKLKEPIVKEEAEEKPPVVKRKKIPPALKIRIIRFLNRFGIFSRNQVVHSMPFILFITMLIMVYIGNSYYAEKMIREIDRTKTDLKEKRAEYISIMSRLMYQSNQSEVAKALEPFQIKETTEPPGKIFITEAVKK